MKNIFVLLFAVTCLHGSTAVINVTDYIYWKKQDISAWHEFFPSRVLEEERQTLGAALDAVQSLADNLNASLGGVVTFQAQELATARLLMQDTDAQGCVEGIASFMQDAIDAEVETYLDCAADATSKLLRLNSTWARTQSAYLAAFQKALSGIDYCYSNYPNIDSINRLVSCVEYMNKNYFAAANATQDAMFPSPSMSYFTQTVVRCASTAATNVAAKGWKFLGMLVECSKLTSTIDPKAYAAELNEWPGYNDTLQEQINSSQTKNYDQVWSVELEMQEYYNLQKQALEQYVIDSRGLAYYLTKTYQILSEYYNTVTATTLDNPGDASCTNATRYELDFIAGDGAFTSLACDLSIVNNTKLLIADVVADFRVLNSLMPTIGNVALLQCFSRGYVFAPSTIADCFDLTYASFDIEHADRRAAVEADVAVLQGYVAGFYSGSDLPCGGSSLRRLLLDGDSALYRLQRCLYTDYGTTYAVSTPPVESTTPVYTPTYQTY